MELEAFIDQFSGRENPRWKLSMSEISFLKTLLEDLKICESVPTEASKLGYRGICVINQGNESDFPKNLRVYNSCITITEQNGNVRLVEDETNIEGWLKDRAKERGYAVLGSI